MKDVLVTGAYGGMGKQVVATLCAHGYRVFACDCRIPEDETEKIDRIPVKMDVTDENSIEGARKKMELFTKELYAIVNLAGVLRLTSILEGDGNALPQSVEVNLFGTYRVVRAFYPLLREGSRIVNISSEIGAYSPAPFNSCYAVSKHALDTFSDALRREIAFLGIRVIKIRAGSFKTGLLTATQTQFDSLLQTTKLYKKQLSSMQNIMTHELMKENDPSRMGTLIFKILEKKRPRKLYSIKRSFKLRLLDALPEGIQDFAYFAVGGGKNR